MPSDANGVHSLPVGYLAQDGETIQPSQHNPPLEDISSDLTSRLPRSGVAPMTGPLKLTDGNASAPGMAFNSDPTFGFYKTPTGIASTKPIFGVLPIGLGPLPWSRTLPPPGWVLCYGQTLSRVTYAELWAVAQNEIAFGNPMYNNGDGSTTFGILDMRGYVTAGADAMGGVPSGRLTSAFLGVPPTIGRAGGAQSRNLGVANLPPYTPTGGVSNVNVTSNRNDYVVGGLATTGLNNGIFSIQHLTGAFNGGVGSTGFGQFTGDAQGGTSDGFGVTQPTLVTHSILYAGA